MIPQIILKIIVLVLIAHIPQLLAAVLVAACLGAGYWLYLSYHKVTSS